MPGFLPDTSCIVALVCAWHEHHGRARKEVERRLERGERMIAAAPALVEAYAVLTRLPPPHRLAPNDALTLLEANFLRQTRIVALDARSYRTLLRHAPAAGTVGGGIYDSVIAACGLRAKAAALLTFNEKHFAFLDERKLQVIVP